MEFYKEADGTQRPLPSKNIDTGMGLERIASILQGTETIFETDLYMPVIQFVSNLTGVAYNKSEKSDVSLRVIADHGRAVTFLISDGVFPGSEGRSYVLRRVLRRAVRHGNALLDTTNCNSVVGGSSSPTYAGWGQSPRESVILRPMRPARAPA
jgi:alanyl-tRNA synthetase